MLGKKKPAPCPVAIFEVTGLVTEGLSCGTTCRASTIAWRTWACVVAGDTRNAGKILLRESLQSLLIQNKLPVLFCHPLPPCGQNYTKSDLKTLRDTAILRTPRKISLHQVDEFVFEFCCTEQWRFLL